MLSGERPVDAGSTLNRTKLLREDPLIDAFAHSLASPHDASLLAYRLKEARQPLPAEICTVAERAVAAFGSRVASMQYAEAGVANGIGRTNDSASRADQ